MDVKIEELMEYTQWERKWWKDWFENAGPAAMDVTTGGERHRTVGDLIRHIFAFETRSVQRFKSEPLTPLSQIPKDSVEDLFDFGAEGRLALGDYTEKISDWNQEFELQVLDYHVKATVRKFVINMLVHEIRHWAQIVLLLRIAGYEELGGHDFLESDAML